MQAYLTFMGDVDLLPFVVYSLKTCSQFRFVCFAYRPKKEIDLLYTH